MEIEYVVETLTELVRTFNLVCHSLITFCNYSANAILMEFYSLRGTINAHKYHKFFHKFNACSPAISIVLYLLLTPFNSPEFNIYYAVSLR